MKRMLTIICLHVLIFVYSLSGICSKMAAGFQLFSPPFIECYIVLVAILGVYAIGWQQIIKRLPLTFAYANKAATTIWTCVWGVLVFHEHISVRRLIGVFTIIIGIVLYALSEEK